MRVHRTNFLENSTPTLQVLTEDQIEAVYYAALRILYETGVRVEDKEGVDVLSSSGAIVEDSASEGRLVKIPVGMVEKARSTLPGKVVVRGSDRRYRMELYKNQIYFGGGADTSFILDPDTGEQRPTTYRDIKNFARLAQALPNMDFHMSMGTAQDMAAGTRDRWQYLAVLEGTAKPITVTGAGSEGLNDLLEMAHLRLGGRKEWRKGPAFSLLLHPASPLRPSGNDIHMLLFAADNDIPCIYAPCPLAGDTGPATLAGLLAQALAEGLFGVVLGQLRKPGSPFILGGLMSNTEPAVATHTNGAPETALFGAGFTDIAKWMRVSTYQSAGSSHAKLFDEQAVMEATLNLATAALIGGNMISNVGCLNADQTCSMTQMVASDEIIDMLKHILRGIPVNDDTMALDVIEDVGPGKHFLTHKHTRGRFEKEIWRPKLMDRKRWSTWSKGGAKRYGQRAQERVRDILATETEALLEEAMYKELRRICELADARHQ